MNSCLKRLTALLLCVLLCLSLCACGEEKTPSASDGGAALSESSAPTEKELEKKLKGVSKVKLDHVYTMSYLPAFDTPEDMWISGISVVNGTAYIAMNYSRRYEVEDGYEWEDGIMLYALPVDGGASAELLLQKPNLSEYHEEECWNRYTNVNNLVVAPDGSLWYQEQGGYSNWADEENYIYTNESALVHTDLQGNELGRMDISTLLNSENDWFYINQIQFPAEGGVLLCGNNRFVLLNTDMTVRSNSQVELNNGWMNQIIQVGSGALIGNYYSYNEMTGMDKQVLVEINPVDGSVTELCDMPFTYSNYFLPGEGDTVLVGYGGSLYSFRFRTGEKTELVNWLNSDINFNRIGNIFALEDGTLLVQEYDRNWNGSKFGILRPNADVVEKYVIHFAASGMDDTMQEAIIDFNKQNDTFRIVYDDYSVYNTSEDYQAGIKKLNQDIVSGNVPDMFFMDGLPYDTYAAKGLLLDLSKRIASSYNMDDFVSNVFDALRYDGKIYSLVPTFGVSTVAAKRSFVGEKPGWTMDDLKALMQRNPEAALFDGMERGSMLSLLLTNTMDSFIDRETGSCSFNSPAFVSLLELVKSFPETIDWSSYYGEDYNYEEADAQYRDGKTLLYQQYLYNYNSIRYLYQQFGGDMTFIGLPAAEGVGSVFVPQLEVAISARTKLDDACWDFIRFLLGEEYQSEITWCFPVRLSCLKALEEEAMKPNNDRYYGGVMPSTAAVMEAAGIVVDDVDAEAEAVTEAVPVPTAKPEAASPAVIVYDGAPTTVVTVNEANKAVAEAVPVPTAEPETSVGAWEIVGDPFLEEAVGEAVEGVEEPALEEPVIIDAPIGYYDDYWNKPLTQEMVDIVNDAIYTCTSVSRDRRDVQAIIEEEAGAFFSGQKTAQQVADIIQSRVSLYVAESM